MSRKTKAISEELLKACKEELKKQGRRGENGRRMQAIISAHEHGIKQVAKIYNISRETLMRWIKKFKQGGSKEFKVAPGRGRRSKLTSEQLMIVEQYIVAEGRVLTSKKLANYIEKQFGVVISNITAYRILKQLAFSYITPRPIHYKQDKSSHEAFKKKSRERSSEQP